MRVRSFSGRTKEDEQNGVWHWFPLTHDLVLRVCEQIKELPQSVFLRAADALHLACAQHYGFSEIYTNDRHMLAAAPHFGLTGINILAS